MSATLLVAVVVLAVVAALVVSLARARTRLGALEARLRDLDARVHARLEPEVAAARAEARDAATTARRASAAAGIVEAPPRLPLEPVTGPVVRAVAFGAGARRALARAAAPVWSRRTLRRSA